MSYLKQSIADAGGVTAVALACGLSPRAIYKWISAGSMPRTEYTGETDYAKKIALRPADSQRCRSAFATMALYR